MKKHNFLKDKTKSNAEVDKLLNNINSEHINRFLISNFVRKNDLPTMSHYRRMRDKDKFIICDFYKVFDENTPKAGRKIDKTAGAKVFFSGVQQSFVTVFSKYVGRDGQISEHPFEYTKKYDESYKPIYNPGLAVIARNYDSKAGLFAQKKIEESQSQLKEDYLIFTSSNKELEIGSKKTENVLLESVIEDFFPKIYQDWQKQTEEEFKLKNEESSDDFFDYPYF